MEIQHRGEDRSGFVAWVPVTESALEPSATHI